MTTIIMLVEDQHLPVPPEVTVHQDFGSEYIVVGDTHSVRGNSMLLEADDDTLRAWLGKFDGFWVTNNPMVGDWRVVHIKD